MTRTTHPVLFTSRDPFAEFDSIVRGTFAAPSRSSGTRSSSPRSSSTPGLDFTPAAETLRDGDDAVVRLELPGLDVGNDVSVEVVESKLVIKGERRDTRPEPTKESPARRHSEIRYGSFERSFGLPSHVGADAVSASYETGILTVRVAGVYAGTEPTRIEITSA